MKFGEWTGVQSKYTKEKITAAVWNRKIEFDKSVMPTSIEIAGKEILHSPITLNAEFSGIVGKWGQQNVIKTASSDESVRYSVSQTTENLIVNADILIEFDGFIKIDLKVLPFWTFHKDNVPRITKLYIDIPLKNDFSTLMHFWPNCESGVCLSGRILNSFETPEGKTDLPFKPYLWAGWEYGGLGIACESDKDFVLDDSEKCMSVTKNKEFTNLHISILDRCHDEWCNRADEWGNNIRPLLYSFAIQPTPVKKFNDKNLQDFRAFHLYYVPRFPIFENVKGNGDTMLEKIASKGTKWLILHEDWTVIQNYGIPENEEVFKEFVRDCHNLGMKLMIYFGYEISSLMPGFNDVCHEYLNKNTRGNFVGGWQREPMQRDFTVCYHGGYSDVMIDRVKHVMDDYGVDGIYTDGTYVPWECANEGHGCGYRDSDGHLKFVYPIYAVREHVKKLYQAVHDRGGIIDTHQSSCCMMPTLAFADSYFDGENIQGMLQEDISKLKLDTFRAEFMGQNMGIPCNFITYTAENFKMDHVLGTTLIHNVLPRAKCMEDLEYTSRVWKIYDDFGTENALWCPYFENTTIKASDEGVYVSFYKKDKKLLLIVDSLNKNITKAVITLDDRYNRAVDVYNGKKDIEISGNKLILPVEYSKINIVFADMEG